MINKELGIVGYLDDNNDYKDLQENLEDFVNFIPVENCNTLNDIKNWLIQNNVECLVVDHKLVNKYEFAGTDVIAFLNKSMPDLPCIIITSYKDDSIAENLVIDLLIKDRDDLPGEDLKLTEFGNTLIQACKIFRKRLEQRKQEFQELYLKKQNGNINVDDEENLQQSYKILKEIGEVDDIPTTLLTSEITNKIDELLELANNCISLERKGNE